jgi:hypothetical protein
MSDVEVMQSGIRNGLNMKSGMESTCFSVKANNETSLVNQIFETNVTDRLIRSEVLTEMTIWNAALWSVTR